MGVISIRPALISLVLTITMKAVAICSALLFALQLLCVPGSACAQEEDSEEQRPEAQVEGKIKSVIIHPPMNARYMCSNHSEGQLPRVRDALGKDCVVVGRVEDRPDIGFYRGDGLENEDYFGWREPLLAPFDGVVTSVYTGAPENRLGEYPAADAGVRANLVVFRRADGTKVTYAHVREVEVSEGDTVRAGEPVARVGNNGTSIGPHVHIGAWEGSEPYQIQFDLRTMGRLRGTLDEEEEGE